MLFLTRVVRVQGHVNKIQARMECILDKEVNFHNKQKQRQFSPLALEVPVRGDRSAREPSTIQEADQERRRQQQKKKQPKRKEVKRVKESLSSSSRSRRGKRIES